MPLSESPAEQSATWYQPSDPPSVPFSPQGGQNHITSWLCWPASETSQGHIAGLTSIVMTYCSLHEKGPLECYTGAPHKIFIYPFIILSTS